LENSKYMNINNLRHISIIAILLLINSLAFAQTSPKSAYKIQMKRDNLFVTYQNKPHKLNVRDKIDAAKITDTKILFANRRDTFTYLVIDVLGQSKAKQDNHQCGAGEEANLLWIKLDAKWQVADINSVRYESCWSTATSDEGYKINDKTLAINISDFHNNEAIKLSYDANAPEKGFKTEKVSLDKP
jgi:hypothetical protein